MTTEDDFQNALDAHPHDWQTRLVFADWLQEHNDPRADGYRALGKLNHVPLRTDKEQWVLGRDDNRGANPFLDDRRCTLPADWFLGLAVKEDHFWVFFPTRRSIEDAAALAFAKLPAARRAELLAAAPAV